MARSPELAAALVSRSSPVRVATVDARLNRRRPAFTLSGMSLDTTAINQRMAHFADAAEVWVFGYGSLIYKADFPFIERRPAAIDGWTRRFWQGSHDHRGTPEAPGRVVTLIAQPGAICHGMAYRVDRATLAHLDVREKNGYLRFVTPLHLDDGRTADGLVYIATEDNAAFLGPAPAHEIARHIARAHGPSGANRDYLLHLADALRAMQRDDPHVFEIERHLREIPVGARAQ